MRRTLAGIAILVATLAAGPVHAAEPRCPLDLATCLNAFAKMRQRPWLGIGFDQDSTGRVVVTKVAEGSPAERSGLKAGDVIEKWEGYDPRKLVAGRAGWLKPPITHLSVRRSGQAMAIDITGTHISEETLARMIGIHMIEGHLAYSNLDNGPPAKK